MGLFIVLLRLTEKRTQAGGISWHMHVSPEYQQKKVMQNDFDGNVHRCMLHMRDKTL